MRSFGVVLALVLCGAVAVQALLVGVAKVDATLPTGVPLAGYNHGPRRVPDWPIPKLGPYTTFMMPSTGHLTPTFAKALIIDDGTNRAAFVTIDAIGADSSIRQLALEIAVSRGVKIEDSNFSVHGSHSHSGPGAISPNFLWAMAPATDLLVPELQRMMAEFVAEALVQAQAAMRPAVLGVGSGLLYNVTVNRRAGLSPYLKPDSIDPNLGIIRIDEPDGTPMATVWNFAIHGVCWGPEQMLSNSDIMGGASDAIEDLVGGVALFINADAGDIDPAPEMCDNKPLYKGAGVIAAKVLDVRKTIQASSDVQVSAYSQMIPFGPTDMNITLQRFDNCTTGGPLDICTLCRVLHCDLNLHLNSAWMEESPTFSAFHISVNNSGTATHALLVTMPGEPLSGLGTQVRSDSLKLGFQYVFLGGYSNAHMGYFCTPEEYDIGGYESQLTFWGIQTSELVRKACATVAAVVRP